MNKVFASDFASISDVTAFNKCKAEGHNDKFCFALGDNGIGFWGDNTAQEAVPMCALPPDDIVAKFGSADKGHLAKVQVTIGIHTTVCLLADHMPWKKNIHNGCGIDLNPAALRALSVSSPLKAEAFWSWA